MGSKKKKAIVHSLYRRAWGALKERFVVLDKEIKADYCKEDIFALMNDTLDSIKTDIGGQNE